MIERICFKKVPHHYSSYHPKRRISTCFRLSPFRVVINNLQLFITLLLLLHSAHLNGRTATAFYRRIKRFHPKILHFILGPKAQERQESRFCTHALLLWDKLLNELPAQCLYLSHRFLPVKASEVHQQLWVIPWKIRSQFAHLYESH